jgi:nucleoside 2-deoxyribosyltransferase
MKKYKVYIAAPLFNEMERCRNSELKEFIKSLGFDVFLAQDDVGLSYDMVTPETKYQVRKQIFEGDLNGIRKSDIIVILLDGRTPDEGACVELGMGWILGKPCIGYKTDNRALDKNGDDNIMIEGCLEFQMTRTLDELRVCLCRFLKDGA